MIKYFIGYIRFLQWNCFIFRHLICAVSRVILSTFVHQWFLARYHATSLHFTDIGSDSLIHSLFCSLTGYTPSIACSLARSLIAMHLELNQKKTLLAECLCSFVSNLSQFHVFLTILMGHVWFQNMHWINEIATGSIFSAMRNGEFHFWLQNTINRIWWAV